MFAFKDKFRLNQFPPFTILNLHTLILNPMICAIKVKETMQDSYNWLLLTKFNTKIHKIDKKIFRRQQSNLIWIKILAVAMASNSYS